MLNTQLTAEEKNWGMGAHLAALCGLVIPFGNIIGPLVVWLMKKDSSEFVNDQGKESLNFQISATIYMIVAALTVLIGIGLILLPIVGLGTLILTIIGAVKASSGEAYRYPMTIRFIN
jgi:uncharacterized Tic20 family protein